MSESDLQPAGRTRRRSSRLADRDIDDPVADDDGSSLDDFADAEPARRRHIAVESSAAADEILQELRVSLTYYKSSQMDLTSFIIKRV